MDKGIKSLGSGVRPLNAPRENLDSKVREVSSLYEKHFLREMVKAMRQTVTSGGMVPDSMGQKIFREQLDSEYVESWGQQGGIGLGDMIYDRLMQQISQRGGAPAQHPLPLDRVKIMQLKKAPPQGSPVRSLRFKVNDLQPQGADSNDQGQKEAGVPHQSHAAPLRAPFSGIVIVSSATAAGENTLVVNHPGGLQSRLVFHGALLGHEKGATVGAGQTLGWATPDQWVHWDIATREGMITPGKLSLT